MPDMVDSETPKTAMSRTGFDGQEYELVFSDEFNTPGRTFYPGAYFSLSELVFLFSFPFHLLFVVFLHSATGAALFRSSLGTFPASPSAGPMTSWIRDW